MNSNQFQINLKTNIVSFCEMQSRKYLKGSIKQMHKYSNVTECSKYLEDNMK